jgi:siroheme synthase
MVHFVGAGPGAADLITLRGAKLLGEADVVVWAGSLVNPELLGLCREGCEIFDSSRLNLEETTETTPTTGKFKVAITAATENAAAAETNLPFFIISLLSCANKALRRIKLYVLL